MSHPDIENRLPFEVGLLYLSDENGVPVVVAVIQAAYSIGSHGLAVAQKQQPICYAGVRNTEAEIASYKYEPQCAFIKLATDVVLIGHAQARTGNTTDLLVRLRVGPLDKSIRVSGERYWVRSFGAISITSPEPFEKVPLIYERAFGGWDRSHPDPEKHAFEPRNPVGTSFRSRDSRFEDGVRLPNLEDPRNPIGNYGDTPPPAGFGFTSPDWQPRAEFAGTYDESWMKERMPLLPKDFDRRFFNAASPGLIAPGYLKGDEPVSIENVSPRGPISINLPGIPSPECRVHLTGGRDALVQTNLDTVIINTDEDLLILIWRGYLPVRNGPHDVVSMQIRAEGVTPPAVA